MATIWITYAWADNRAGDVDFIAQELRGAGLTVKLDRWNIGAGRRLWDQIEHLIVSPTESDAWLLVATQNSLQSEPCKEEFAYALDRTLRQRGDTFPVIALFPGDVDDGLVPAGIRTRLFVAMTDPDWKERIAAATEHRGPQINPAQVQPFVLTIHRDQGGQKPLAIEVRPRAGVWAPFFAAIPSAEKDEVDPHIMVGPREVPTGGGMLVNTGAAYSDDRSFWVMFAGNQATPTTSYYIWCKTLPSQLAFGVNGRQPQYIAQLSK